MVGLDEFERRFNALWQEKYSLYDAATDHWTQERIDQSAKQQARAMLLQYAREVQSVGVARRGKNKAQRIFDELGIDPASLALGAFDAAAPVSGRSGAALTRSRIMYIERKAGNLTGDARIGRVTYSKSGRTLYYGGRSFRSLGGEGFKANFYCVETGEEYWISGPRRDGADRLYGERLPIYIDADVREEYWKDIRGKPEWKERDLA